MGMWNNHEALGRKETGLLNKNRVQKDKIRLSEEPKHNRNGNLIKNFWDVTFII